MNFDYDVAIIGSGPGGYVAGIRAAQLKLKTVIIEKSDIGGICLNWGCIPSKSLINQAKIFSRLKDLADMGLSIDKTSFDYSKVFAKSRDASDRLTKGVAFLLNKNNVDLVKGTGKILNKNTVLVDNDREISAKNIIIAAGSSPKELTGFKFDSENILSSTDALNLKKLPGSIAILGAGAIGVEFAYILSSFGCEVSLIEFMPSILPNVDKEVSDVLSRVFRKKKINVFTSAKAVSYEKNDNKLKLKLQINETERFIEIEKIIVAAGRSANITEIGLENAGIETENGFIKTYKSFKTKIDNIYAIGDIINYPQLAHVASKAGEIAAESIAGIKEEEQIKIDQIPYGVYCEPQVAGFGLTEEQVLNKNLNYKKSVYFYRANGKAVAIEEIEGVVKLIYDPDTKLLLGAHIAGSEATELVHELLLVKKAGLKIGELAEMIHAHPTLSEALMETSKYVYGTAIHI
ncbi:MAG: dihydrolipoyl dehydrogenase [Spirochaetes bacterium]|nr:dihydrolipoyl dehydrogenase [Spirochaetota bacterium]